MPRDGSGNFTLPANTQAVSGDPISSTKFNTLVQDLETDANTDRPIVAGGTGASTALAARANLGLEIGVNVQAFDAGLLSIAGLTTLADRSIYTTASDTYAVYTLTAAGRAILDDADAAAQRTTLGLGTAAVKNTGTSGDAVPLLNGNNTFSGSTEISGGLFISANFGGVEGGEFTLKSPATTSIAGNVTVDVHANSIRIFENAGAFRGVVIDLTAQGSQSTVWTSGTDGAGSGLDADLIDGVQPSAFALTILDDADAAAVRTTIGAGIGDMLKSDNLSGLTNYATARTNLGLAIGTDVQALDATLTALAGLATGADKLPYSTGTDTFAQADFTAFGRSLVDDADASAARTTLGLANGATTTISAFALTMLDDVDAAAVRATIGVGLGTGDLVAANNLSDVANASTARTNLGLAIGTNVQAYDAGLQSIAGLTTEADRGIYTTASDTYAVYTLTAAGRAILDDADAAAQRTTLGLNNGATTTFSTFALTLADDADAAASRTTLGLGTIATQNANNVAITGGSVAGITDLAVADGGTGASDAGTARTNLGLGSLATASTINNNNWSGTDLAVANGGTGASDASTALTNLGALAASAYTASDVLSKLLTVDGAGSGLDADTLDGVQGSAYATLAANNAFTAFQPVTVGGGTIYVGVSANGGGRKGIGIYHNGTKGFIDCIEGAVAWHDLEISVDTLIVTSATNKGLQARIASSSETTSTLTVASANRTIQATGDITIPNAVFAAGDIILIYAGASSRTITEGASVTMRLGGTATTGSRTLAARGVAVLFFVSSSEVVVSGGAVT